MRKWLHRFARNSDSEYCPYIPGRDYWTDVDLFSNGYDDWAITPGYEGEMWTYIDDHDGYYISDYARIYSFRAHRFLKPAKQKSGYLFVFIRHNSGKYHTRRIHRLMAEAFVVNEHPEIYDIVRHLDGDMYNNSVENLAWGTTAQNREDALRHGTGYIFTDEDRRIAQDKLKQKVIVYDMINREEMIFNSLSEACRKLGLNMGHASMCANGQVLHTRQYVLDYLD